MLSTQRSEALVAELDSPRFRRINGTVRSLVEQLLLASLGFGVAFLLTWLVADVWLEVTYEGTGLVIHAVLVAVFGGLMLFLTSGAPIHLAVVAQRALVREATQELAAESARHRFRAAGRRLQRPPPRRRGVRHRRARLRGHHPVGLPLRSGVATPASSRPRTPSTPARTCGTARPGPCRPPACRSPCSSPPSGSCTAPTPTAR